MEPVNQPEVVHKSDTHKVAPPISKYLAMILFILFLFIGAWVGYIYAPDRALDIEKVVQNKIRH